MKKFLLLIFLFASAAAFGRHLKGGFFTYAYLGPGTNNATASRYHITLTVYMDCGATGAQVDNPINFTFFRGGGSSSVFFMNASASISQQYLLAKVRDEPCIDGNQAICFYKIVIYDLPDVELPANPAGYTVSYQRCCRIPDIINIEGASDAYGNTYTAFIPGTATLPTGHNSSANFQINDTIVICHNNYFQYSFSANDPDGDSLSYSFCEAYTGGSQGSPNPSQAAVPPYATISYSTGFNGSSPLGKGVTLNPQTGLISGTAPPQAGEYVVTVCVNEYRNGVLITTTRKELHFSIKDCQSVQALPAAFDINGIKVQPGLAGCKSYTYNFDNDIPDNVLVQSYYWEFSDGATYNVAHPTHTFTDTGVYTVKLVLNRGQDCSDSATTKIKIYPGFFPGFTSTGVCVNKTTRFFDTTKTLYGTVNTWRWDFGETTATNDTSRLRNPVYTYPATGTKTVTFIVGNSVGCVDTVTKDIEILLRPPLSVAFKDTLICNGDSVQLHAVGDGDFTWTPPSRIINANTADPTVFPVATASYFVRLDYQGCLADDTVKVRVVDFVTLSAAPKDTTVCFGDTLRLRTYGDGLRFLWDNAATLSNPTLASPRARPVNDPTVYTVTAYIGPRCRASDYVTVHLTPYSKANAGNDTTICYNTIAQLAGSTDGTLVGWYPATGLNDPASLTPTTAKLRASTKYILQTVNALGCITRDTVKITVNPEVIAFAGRDTAVVVRQPLQLAASGGLNYSWSPTTALNNPLIPNPKAVYYGEFDSIRYTVTVTDSIGCADAATVLVKIFRTNPMIFVPTAFTPNGDGRNEFAAAVAVGITRLDYFRIFNRWGQLVFQTTVNGKGWDGKVGGQLQSTGVYVWVVRGTDYTGKVVFDKGTVTLIR